MENKGSKKIAIITGSFIVLVVITMLLFDLNKGYEGTSISSDPFKPVANSAISERIKEKDYKTARNAFDSIYQMIDIQGKLILKDGSHLTPIEEIDSLKLSAYNEAVECLIKEYDAMSKSSKWSLYPLLDIKSQATYYRDLYPSSDNFYEPNLTKIINTINDYYAAMKLCENSGAVTTVAGIRNIESQAKKYKRHPLTNDTDLSSQLNSAPQRARNSVSAYIERRATNLKNEITTFSTKEEFMEKYNSINSSLNDYVNSYGNNSNINSARANLALAKVEAEKYFSSLQSNIEYQSNP